MRTVIVTADDYGLTRAASDAILETFDAGALTRVSILANGYAVDYALAKWQERAGRLELSLHLNLSEGKALSAPEDIPHLVHENGDFRFMPGALLLQTLLPWKRRVLRAEIGRELAAQVARIRSHIGDDAPLFIDGHQHVHMVPFVLAAILDQHARQPFAGVRIPHEPLAWIPSRWRAYVSMPLIRNLGLNLLSALNGRRARRAQMPASDGFIGSLCSGQLDDEVVGRTLAAMPQNIRAVEIGIHPGVATPGELDAWEGDRTWHVSDWRRRENVWLLSPECRTVLDSWRDGTLPRGTSLGQVARFIVSGTAAAATHLGTLYLLVSHSGWSVVPAATAGWCAGFVVSFTLQKFWTFRQRDAVHAQALRYLLLQGGNVVLNAVLIYILADVVGFWYLGAQFVVLVTIAVWTFFASRRFVFTDTGAARA